MVTTIPNYRRVAELLRDRLIIKAGDDIQSIVLFGSVARGKATAESDIDVLIISRAPFQIERRTSEIAYDLILEFEVVIHLLPFTANRLEKHLRMGSWFSRNLFREGIVLYDDGTYRRLSNEGAAPGAVDRAYYSIHFSAVAVLSSRGVEPPKSHHGLINLFNTEIVRRGVMAREFGRILTNANDRRMTSTWDLDAEVPEDVARSAVNNAESFLDAAQAAIGS